MAKPKDLTNKKFGRLTAINLHLRDEKSNSYWLCKCNCGKETIVLIGSLTSGNTKSCGCYREEQSNKALIERSTTHGETKTRLHNIWHGMKQRCGYKKSINYKWYGAKGISVCDEWGKSYITFRDWAISNGYEGNLSIDRIDFNKNYEASNCRWVTPKEQANNRSNNKNITHNGVTKNLNEWAEHLNIKESTISMRLKIGWSESDAVTKPVGNYKKCN